MRSAIDCFEDAYLRDSIIISQDETINTQERENKALRMDNLKWREEYDKTEKQLQVEKPKKWKWGFSGIGIGVILGLLIR